ncbi:MAG: DUF3937 family protein [Segatella copri]|uniref:DUF3937 family protein n=1 Tax=Segatella TaxID=2974251 RepID=UPI001885934A
MISTFTTSSHLRSLIRLKLNATFLALINISCSYFTQTYPTTSNKEIWVTFSCVWLAVRLEYPIAILTLPVIGWMQFFYDFLVVGVNFRCTKGCYRNLYSRDVYKI